MAAAICDIKQLAVAARIEAMRADARRYEADLLEGVAIDQEHAVGVHICNVEDFAVGGDADVLRHAALRQLEVADHAPVHEIDLYEVAAVELASEDGVAAVDGEVGVVDAVTIGRRQRRLQ